MQPPRWYKAERKKKWIERAAGIVVGWIERIVRHRRLLSAPHHTYPPRRRGPNTKIAEGYPITVTSEVILFRKFCGLFGLSEHPITAWLTPQYARPPAA